MMPSFDAFLKSAIKPIYADAPWVLLEGNIEKIEEQTYMTYKLLNAYLALLLTGAKKTQRNFKTEPLYQKSTLINTRAAFNHNLSDFRDKLKYKR